MHVHCNVHARALQCNVWTVTLDSLPLVGKIQWGVTVYPVPYSTSRGRGVGGPLRIPYSTSRGSGVGGGGGGGGTPRSLRYTKGKQSVCVGGGGGGASASPTISRDKLQNNVKLSKPLKKA